MSDPITGHPHPLGTRTHPTLARTTRPVVAATQPSDGPGVWWDGHTPRCVHCSCALNDSNTAHNDGEPVLRPASVRSCPMCSDAA